MADPTKKEQILNLMNEVAKLLDDGETTWMFIATPVDDKIMVLSPMQHQIEFLLHVLLDMHTAEDRNMTMHPIQQTETLN